MVARRRAPPRKAAAGNGSAGTDEGDIYGDMLAEAGVSVKPLRKREAEPPLKKRRVGGAVKEGKKEEPAPEPLIQPSKYVPNGRQRHDEEEDEEEEDPVLDDFEIPKATTQTMELNSDDEDSDEDMEFEDVQFEAWLNGTTVPDPPSQPKNLELNLSAAKEALTPKSKQAARRRALSKEERVQRRQIHQTHLLCLLAHVARRNMWCNDKEVQERLRRLVPEKTAKYLTPGANLSQFGRAESLKRGLGEVGVMWKTRFAVEERGLRRALWAEDVNELEDYHLPEDMDSCFERADFREAAKSLSGSRDVGAQLYCALLRSVGVKARLVCSLQPLACVTGAPALEISKSKKGQGTGKLTMKEQTRIAAEKYREAANATASGSSPATSSRRRLGHPNATAYNFEPSATSSPPKKPRSSTFDAPKKIKESSHPVYWVEILDVGHQKWQPVDAVVTHTFWKPRVLEPPITDRENCLSYVVAFNEDGTARDVTRRYAKAYAAKTRRLRVETAMDGGNKWWRRALKTYTNLRGPGDLDQIEDQELGNLEAKEPMPRNVQDFKDHPVYALERHLRRAEVLSREAMPSGTVAAGSKGPLEKIWRRRDVRVVRSVDRWYRMGREVKPNEIPAKWLPKRAKPRDERDYDDDDRRGQEDDVGVPAYTLDQTEAYQPPPVRNGKVPKNKFGNIDVYVPSMVPRGGVHITHPLATRASFLLGIDYAPALTGFSFKGRHGTAVLSGVVIPKECEEGVKAVIEALGDVEREELEEKKRRVVLKVWRRFLMGLRVRERVWEGVGREEREEEERAIALEVAERRLEKGGEGEDEDEDGDEEEEEFKGEESDETEEFDMEVGGDDDDEYMGGGFMVE